MTREELDYISAMNMCDEISNEAYRKISCHCEVNEPKTEQEMQDLRLELHEQKLRLKDLKSELDMKVLNINTRIQELQADAQVVFEKMDRIEKLNIDATKIKKLEENVRIIDKTQNDMLNYLSDQAEKKGEGNA